jgi:hypothetical protein
MRACAALLVFAALGGCHQSFDPPSYVTGLRVLAVKADPPELTAGESGTMTVLAVNADGAPIDATWDICLLTGGVATTVDPACLTSGAGPDFASLGAGTSVRARPRRPRSARLDGRLLSSGARPGPGRPRERAGRVPPPLRAGAHAAQS